MKFQLVKVPGDGDCFYHAFIAGLTRSCLVGSKPTVRQLRRYVARKIATEQDLFDDLVAELLDFGLAQRRAIDGVATFSDTGKPITPEQAASRIRKGDWATSTTIHILAKGFRVQVRVVQKIEGKYYTEIFPSEWTLSDDFSSKGSIYMYKTPHHFDLMEQDNSFGCSWPFALVVAVFAFCTLH